ncbi:hypothetical protein [Hungatella hathewayi]|uniref:hypothetical protein n=1 Tax=Hungatella hathewayi TaxID=154046 RepID=UPI0035651B87
MRDTKECRLPGDPGLMDMQWEVMDMQKYIDNLDDFEDDSRPPIVDWVEWLLVGIFDLAGAGGLCLHRVSAVDEIHLRGGEEGGTVKRK